MFSKSLFWRQLPTTNKNISSVNILFLNLYLLIIFLIIVNKLKFGEAGCQQQRLCCAGRNATCKAIENFFLSYWPSSLSTNPEIKRDKPVKIYLPTTTTANFPSVFVKKRRRRWHFAVRRKHEKIGILIMPYFIALYENGAKYARKFGQKIHFKLFEENRKTKRSLDEILYFGMPTDDPPLPETTELFKGYPIIRYSLLNKYLPLRIGKRKIYPTDSYNNYNPFVYSRQNEENRRLIYLTESDPECYCDEYCLRYNDCCADFDQFCSRYLGNVQNCYVSNWSEWSNCVITINNINSTNFQNACGSGNQKRKRVILQSPSKSGKTCPNLVEIRACFHTCQKQQQQQQKLSRKPRDETTVALLLDYAYNSSRQIIHPNETKWDDKWKKLLTKDNIYYCVEYELGWVNRNCIERKWKSKLFRNNKICAECQPEAQLHRNSPRCASDLEDGEKGFWKLIGPSSCSGIWKRIRRTNYCQCGKNFSILPSFLLV